MLKLDIWSRYAVRALCGVVIASVLAACGGGGSGNAGTPVVGPGSGASSPSSGASSPTSTTSAADLVVVLSKTSLINSSTDSLKVTVTAIDSNRATVSDVPVAFSINSNAIVTPGGTKTGTDGTVTASVSEGSDTSTRSITVTATSGSVSRAVSFAVVPSAGTTTPEAADLTLALDASSINNSGSGFITATATAVDTNRNALSGIPVQFAVNSNAIVAVTSNQTNASGQAKAQISIGSDRTNRTVTVTATSGTLTRTAAFLVSGASLQATALPTVLTAGSSGNKVNFALLDVNKNPMSGQAITVSGAGLTSATGTTDANGLYTYTYAAPTTPGSIVVNASAGGTTAAVTVTVPSGTSTVPAVTTTVSSASLQLSPNVVQVNTNGSNNIATLTALFVNANNAPIQNIRVRFDLNGDTNSVGGTIGAGTNLIYTDATGNAVSTYSPGAVQSPTNGLTIRACWDYADFAAGTCPNQVTGTMTVSATPVSISIGTDETISTGASTLTYVKKYVVLVVDSAGNPKGGVQITPSIDLKNYYKGYYTRVVNTWVQTVMAGCPNEDLNRNGVIDTGEDINGNGQLDPRKSDVSITMVGSTKTDANGVAIMQIEYPKSFATWVDFIITASASGVLSPPAYYLSPTTPQVLPAEAAAFTSQASPAFVNSPYGSAASCTNPN